MKAGDRLDRGFFKKGKAQDADNNVAFWRTKSMEERLKAAYRLSLRAFGYDPDNPPKMDKSHFEIRKRN
jgi:hypothetical protein